MNWYSVASLLADLVDQALFVVDVKGDVCLVNEAAEHLLEHPREELIGRALGRLVPRERHDQLAALLAAALQGARRRGELAVQTASNERLTLALETSLVTGDDGCGLVCRVTARRREAPIPVLTDAWLEIRVDDDFGRIRHSYGADHSGAIGRHCFEVVAGMASPCPDCPVGRLPPGETITDLQLLASGDLVVRRAHRTSAQTAQVAHTRLDPGMMSQLLDARITSAALRAKLSAREREVLAELAAGRALEDIAKILAISTRTVRFHQANILAKLGLESRLELPRALLE